MNPNDPADSWSSEWMIANGKVRCAYERVPNLGYQLYVSPDMRNWTPWDVPGNTPQFGADTVQDVIEGPYDPGTRGAMFFQWRLITP